MKYNTIRIVFSLLITLGFAYGMQTRSKKYESMRDANINTIEAIKAILVARQGYTAEERWMLFDSLQYKPAEALEEVLNYGHTGDAAFYQKKFGIKLVDNREK